MKPLVFSEEGTLLEGPMSEVVITQDISSGRIHRRYRTPGGNLATLEQCNLDQAGDYRVLADIGDAPEPFTLCRNCFPAAEVMAMSEPDFGAVVEQAGLVPEDDGSTHGEMEP